MLCVFPGNFVLGPYLFTVCASLKQDILLKPQTVSAGKSRDSGDSISICIKLGGFILHIDLIFFFLNLGVHFKLEEVIEDVRHQSGGEHQSD